MRRGSDCGPSASCSPMWSTRWFSTAALLVCVLCNDSAGVPVVHGGQPAAALVADPVNAFFQGNQPPAAADALCDLTVWDTTRETRGVRSVTTRCAEGRVTWRLPYGGLRIAFLPPTTTTTTSDDVMEICVIVTSSFCAVKLSLDQPAAGELRRSTLVNSSTADFCFRSSADRQQVALYAEAVYGRTALTLGRVTFEYDVRVVRGDDPDGMDDCRPCTDEELLVSVCTADYAIEGRMSNVTDDAAERWTTIDVEVSSVLHQTNNFLNFLDATRRQSGSGSRNNIRRHSSANESPRPRPLGQPPKYSATNGVSRSFQHSSASAPVVQVTVPYRCRVHRGDGQFVFVGRVRLGRTLTLRCAPRVDEFLSIWNAAEQVETNPCVLEEVDKMRRRR